MQSVVTDELSVIKDAIAKRIGQQKYSIWFKNSTQMTISGDYLKIGVPNLFVGSWIENHFQSDLVDAVRQVTGQEKKVSFSVEPELSSSQKRPQVDSQAQQVTTTTQPTVATVRKPKARPANRALNLTLDEFVVGPSNSLAFNAAKAVATNKEKIFNPLFIHGSYGIGKTHLMQGVCNEVNRLDPTANCIYVSAEEFTNQFVNALKTRKLDEFRKKFRKADVLAIDDIHFLANKKSTQEEFLHTFNTIDMANKKVILASDAHPKMIGQLTESLVSRFVSGMVVKVEAPDYQTRLAICTKKAAGLKVKIQAEVLEYIASNIKVSVRELEGALVKVAAFSDMTGTPISLGLVHQVLAEHVTKTDPIVHFSDIESQVASFFGVTPADIQSSKKDMTVSLARSISMYLTRKYTSMSYPEIGRVMGGKNHATVLTACKKIEKMISQNLDIKWKSIEGKRIENAASTIKFIEDSLSYK